MAAGYGGCARTRYLRSILLYAFERIHVNVMNIKKNPSVSIASNFQNVLVIEVVFESVVYKVVTT